VKNRNSLMLQQSFIKDELLKVEDLLNKTVVSEVNEIPLIYSYMLEAGGKRLRPALVILSHRIFSDNNDSKVTKLSMAVEVIHMASLIHDDVIDDNSLRRGKLTPNYKWGNKIAVFVGDFMLLNVLNLLAEEVTSHILLPLFNSIAQMCEGELLQIRKGSCINLKEKDYMKIIEYKTGSLMSACCEVGSKLAMTGYENVKLLAEYGKDIGMAFQIVDDLMDLTSTSRQIGKTAGNDLREGKITLPLIRTYKEASNKDRDSLLNLIHAYVNNQNLLEDILFLVNKYGGIDYSRQKALNYVNMAISRLKGLKDSEAKRNLIDLGEYVISRVN